ncbi:DsrE/DsrF/TusD sulfur relay family protein [Bacillus cereus]|uniref:DsrE/DsrF/TusD sulfur relay family protein n=1 Tax=Bacillus cereus group TaxID=86661 RepID=UPI0033052DBA|nr:DsrE family protein [Bacillus cereus]HDR7714156.1 DsrE family protein [Bacillus cereus]
MKLGIILETKEPEKVWNAFRFANTALKKLHKVKLFLMGEAVECESIEHEKFKVQDEMNKFEELNGELLACGTCLKSRLLDETTSCPISTMNDCVELVEWADKVVTF